jgi:Uma2 family endonuclease
MIVQTSAKIIYPDRDGQPMSDNTKQFRWIVTIKENLELIFAQDPNVFVAGDLLWYPVEGDNTIRNAPDVMVVCGRPKGDRGSYRQWDEDNVPPQVVFEILSPGNRMGEMNKKLRFYEQYGVEEYYIYDPDRIDLTGWLRQGDRLESISQGEGDANDEMEGWVSPKLMIKFELQPDNLAIYRPDGEKFLGFIELDEQRRIAQAQGQIAQEQGRIDREQRLIAEAKASRLAAKLRELGVDSDTIDKL